MLRQGLKSIHRQVAKKEFAPIASVSKRFIETGIEDLPEEERPNKLEEYKKTLITNILTDPAAESNITKDVTLLQSLTSNKQQLASVLKLSAQVGATLAYQGWEAGDMVKNAPVRVAVTGAAGAIGYSLIPRILSGEFLGPRQPVILHLIEKNDPAAMKALQGVVMEVEDCAFPLCRGIIATSDLSVGFKDVDYVFLVGAKAKEQNMERRDLLKENAKIFVEQGGALNDHAKKSALTLVVGNPANTNALIASSNAPKLAASQFSALMRLDQQRAYAQVSLKTGVPVSKLNKIIVWGNHSATQFPDVNQATATLADGKEAKLVDLIKDNEWIQKTFITALQQRSDEASAASAADAALKHMRDWAMGTNGSWTSMAVPSDGSYGVAPGVYVSYPVVCTGAGKYEVVKGLNLDKFSQDKIAASVKELQEERKGVEALLGKSKK